MYRHDRQSRGGGVLIAVNDKISSQKLPLPANLEVLSVRLNLPNPVTVCTAYIYPNITAITITKPYLIFFQIEPVPLTN